MPGLELGHFLRDGPSTFLTKITDVLKKSTNLRLILVESRNDAILNENLNKGLENYEVWKSVP